VVVRIAIVVVLLALFGTQRGEGLARLHVAVTGVVKAPSLSRDEA